MACGTLVIWRPVPAGSIVKAQASGNDNKFNVTIGINRNGTAESPWRHDDLVPGPAETTFEAGDRLVLNPVIVLFDDDDDGVTLEVWIEDPEGNPVEVRASGGTTAEAKCSWTVTQEMNSPVLLKIVILSQ